MAFTVNSLFAGCGGMDLGFQQAGFEIAGAWDFDKYAVASYKENVGDHVKQVDIREMSWKDMPKANVWTFGFPCFPEGTNILTKNGFKDISEIIEGDEVLTHKGRWRKVLHTMIKFNAPIIEMKGHGHPRMLTTEEHPFWASKVDRKWNNERRSYDRTFANPEWVDAKDMRGSYWSSPHVLPVADIPPITVESNRENLPCPITPELMWVVGAWLGDGWLNESQRYDRPEGQLNGKVIICTSHEEADILADQIERAGLHATRSPERTTVKFCISSKPLTRWIKENFGSYSDQKTIPSWALGMDLKFRRALFQGYVFADGDESMPYKVRITSVSKNLIIGAKILAQSLGYSVALHYTHRKPTARIEGRIVYQNDTWQLVAEEIARSSFIIGEHRFGLVRDIDVAGLATVYNFEVEEDNSYIADGIVVHNCQDLSIAGKQEGMQMECQICKHVFNVKQAEHRLCPECKEADFKPITRSGLFFEVMRLLEETHENAPNQLPDVIMAENVKPLKNYLGVLEEEYNARGYKMYYQLYNSKHWGVPQSRERYYVVGIRDDIKKEFIHPVQQTDFIPKLSSVLEEDVPEKYYMSDEKATAIIQQAMLKLTELGKVHATLTPHRVEKRQNGPRSRPDEDPMFTITAQDLHGVIERVEGTQSFYIDKDGCSYCCDANYFKGTSPGDLGNGRRTQIVEAWQLTEQRTEEAKLIRSDYRKLHGKDFSPRRGKEMVPRTDSLANCLTTAPTKEQLVLEEHQPRIEVVGMLDVKGKDQTRRVYNPDGLSPTLTAVQGGLQEVKILDYIKYRVRKLTPREYARLQGFPETYKFVCSDSQMYKQFGNSCTVNVVQGLATAIINMLSEEKFLDVKQP